jgi:HSP20 family molecular chaperone IbpA
MIMAAGQELQVQEKRELQKKDELTVPARVFLPTTDIYESDSALTLVMEMPGVDKANLDIHLEDGVLSVDGRIDFSRYENLQAVYTEYNIGHYRRSFSLSPSRVDQAKIKAELNDGVLSLTLPKAEQAKPRRIAVG